MSTSDEGGENRGRCTACRGSGRVISSLGDSPHEVQCPWCDGTGEFQPGRDAQHVGHPSNDD